MQGVCFKIDCLNSDVNSWIVKINDLVDHLTGLFGAEDKVCDEDIWVERAGVQPFPNHSVASPLNKPTRV